MDKEKDKEKENDEYSLKRIYEQMELELIESFYRNLKKHLKEEKDLGFSWEMWQSAMLRNLEDYRKNVLKITQSYNQDIEEAIEEVLEMSYDKGAKHVQDQIDIPQDGKNVGQVLSKPPAEQSFFGMNKKKLNALIEATTDDFKQANKAIYRQMDDVYRQVIHNTEFKLSSGAVSLGKAIDLATQDFLSRGINCIIYKNGRRVNVATYAEMALRTASQRATFLGEGAKRDEHGTFLVLISVHANACELCLQWQGEILIDDIFAHPSEEYIANNSKYKLLSTAIKAGFLHPNCRHTLINYIEGVTRVPNKIPDENVIENYNNEQYQRKLENKIRYLKRLTVGTVDPDEKRKYSSNLKATQMQLKKFLEEHPEFKRNQRREQTYEAHQKMSGALNDINDPDNTGREHIATKLYKQIVNRKKEYEIKAVAKSSGFSVEDIERVYNHVFIREHLFEDGTIKKFDPDYYMAHSWLRLREGKNIQKHDITMLYHELAEEKIMQDSLDISYNPVHREVEKTYNYQKELLEYLKNHDV